MPTLLSLSVGSLLVILPLVHFYSDDAERQAVRFKDDEFVRNQLMPIEYTFKQKLLFEIERTTQQVPAELDSVLADPVREEFVRYAVKEALTKLQMDTSITIGIPDSLFKEGWLSKQFGKESLIIKDSINIGTHLQMEKVLRIIDDRFRTKSYTDPILYSDLFSRTFRFRMKLNYLNLIVSVTLVVFLWLIFYLTFGYSDSSTKRNRQMEDYQSASQINAARRTMWRIARLKPEDREKRFKQFKKQFEAKLDELQKLTEPEYYSHNEVVYYKQRASHASRKSTVLLILGLLVAVIGILVFILTLPEASGFGKQNLAGILRPALMLIFIEAVAFYLLKQHRVCLEDYKHLLGLYRGASGIALSMRLAKSDSKYSTLVMDLMKSPAEGTSKPERSEGDSSKGALLDLIERFRDMLKG